MNKKYLIKILIIIFLFLPTLITSGCQGYQDYAIIEQDQKMTGGNLTYDYNQDSHIVTIGGEGETILYYYKNELKGWTEDGCRVGLKFIPPKNLDSFDAIEISINGKKQQLNFIYVNNENTGIFEIYPLIKNTQEILEINVLWNNNSNQQTYKLKIATGTQLMQKESTT